MSVAPEIARLAEALLPAPRQPGISPQGPENQGPEKQGTQPTLGTLARRLRMIAAAPERWWGLVGFGQDRSVKITVEEHPSYQAWLVILPPGGTWQDCDCDVATIIAGEAIEGTRESAVLRPGPLRVHGQPHVLRGQGAGYSVTLHARVHRQAMRK